MVYLFFNSLSFSLNLISSSKTISFLKLMSDFGNTEVMYSGLSMDTIRSDNKIWYVNPTKLDDETYRIDFITDKSSTTHTLIRSFTDEKDY